MANHVPTLTPTMEEFCNFSAYLASLDDLSKQYGIVKVIPPKGWATFDKQAQTEQLKRVSLRPIRQVIGREGKGAFSLAIMDRKKVAATKFIKRTQTIEAPFDYKTATFEEIEKAFWRSMSTYKEAPLYGADVQGSLMGDSDCSGWHLDKLDTVLSQCAGKALGGITRAMLYFGSWRAMFAWHKEDMDLYSINYLHGGAPKMWYAVPPPLAGRFEAMADGWFPQERMRCKEYLRHKTCMMSPSVLKASNITFHTAMQRPGEFVITFPRGYHGGFNAGPNIAEATNMATAAWVPLGRAAKICKCNPDSVHIDMDYFEWRLRLLQQGFKPDMLPDDDMCASALARVQAQQQGGLLTAQETLKGVHGADWEKYTSGPGSAAAGSGGAPGMGVKRPRAEGGEGGVEGELSDASWGKAKVPATEMTLDTLRQRLLGEAARQRLAMQMAMGGEGAKGGVIGADELRQRVLASDSAASQLPSAEEAEPSVGAAGAL